MGCTHAKVVVAGADDSNIGTINDFRKSDGIQTSVTISEDMDIRGNQPEPPKPAENIADLSVINESESSIKMSSSPVSMKGSFKKQKTMRKNLTGEDGDDSPKVTFSDEAKCNVGDSDLDSFQRNDKPLSIKAAPISTSAKLTPKINSSEPAADASSLPAPNAPLTNSTRPEFSRP